MTRNEYITNRIALNIRQAMHANNFTQADLAREADMPLRTLESILGGYSRNPGICTMLKISDALGLELGDLLA